MVKTVSVTIKGKFLHFCLVTFLLCSFFSNLDFLRSPLFIRWSDRFQTIFASFVAWICFEENFWLVYHSWIKVKSKIQILIVNFKKSCNSAHNYVKTAKNFYNFLKTVSWYVNLAINIWEALCLLLGALH